MDRWNCFFFEINSIYGNPFEPSEPGTESGIYTSGTISEAPSDIDTIGGFFGWLLEGLENALAAIGNGIANIANSIIDGFKALFIPDENVIKGQTSALNTTISEKFGIIDQTRQLLDIVFNPNSNMRMTAESSPFTITAWGSDPIEIIDFSLFYQFKEQIHSIIVAVAWGLYIIKLYRSIPGIIGGFGGFGGV